MTINSIHAGLAVSVSELKKNPTGVMKEAGMRVVAVLNHNKPLSYLVPAELFERLDLAELLEDLELTAVVRSRIQSNKPSVKVPIDEL